MIDTSSNLVVNSVPVGVDPYEVAINLHKAPVCPVSGYLPPTLQFSPSPGSINGLENQIVDVNHCSQTGAVEQGIIRYKVAVPMGCPAFKMKTQKVTFGAGDNPIITQFGCPYLPRYLHLQRKVFHEIGGIFVSLGVAFADVTFS